MNAATSLPLASTPTIAAPSAIAQTAVRQITAAPAPQAIDPIYAIPRASLTTQQITTLQRLAADGPQLNRYRNDNAKLALPAAVLLLLAGANALAGDTGLSSLQTIEDNLQSMSDLAKAHNIRVILASVLPVSDYPWRRGIHPATKSARSTTGSVTSPAQTDSSASTTTPP
jgi:hypothetical protein